MKKIILFLTATALIVLNTSIKAQENTIKKVVFEENRWELGCYSIHGDIYPSVSIESFSNFQSGFGIWGFFNYQKPLKTRAYEKIEVSMSIAPSYNFNENFKIFSGINFNLKEGYFGLTSGTHLKSEKFEFRLFGVYPVYSSFCQIFTWNYLPEENSEEEFFDFKPYWRTWLSYKLSQKVKIGLMSEKNYFIGIFSEYQIIPDKNGFRETNLKLMSGKNVLSEKNYFFIGLTFLM